MPPSAAWGSVIWKSGEFQILDDPSSPQDLKIEVANFYQEGGTLTGSGTVSVVGEAMLSPNPPNWLATE
jgi:hypothetical protein